MIHITPHARGENWNCSEAAHKYHRSDRSPRGGRELKSTGAPAAEIPRYRSPGREQELKYYLAEPAGIGYRSLPTQGARIEIALKEELLEIAATAPHVGSENWNRKQAMHHFRNAASLLKQGARIEIRISLRNHVFARRSLLTQERELKCCYIHFI